MSICLLLSDSLLQGNWRNSYRYRILNRSGHASSQDRASPDSEKDLGTSRPHPWIMGRKLPELVAMMERIRATQRGDIHLRPPRCPPKTVAARP